MTVGRVMCWAVLVAALVSGVLAVGRWSPPLAVFVAAGSVSLVACHRLNRALLIIPRVGLSVALDDRQTGAV